MVHMPRGKINPSCDASPAGKPATTDARCAGDDGGSSLTADAPGAGSLPYPVKVTVPLPAMQLSPFMSAAREQEHLDTDQLKVRGRVPVNR